MTNSDVITLGYLDTLTANVDLVWTYEPSSRHVGGYCLRATFHDDAMQSWQCVLSEDGLTIWAPGGNDGHTPPPTYGTLVVNIAAGVDDDTDALLGDLRDVACRSAQPTDARAALDASLHRMAKASNDNAKEASK
jgi:hypothetical protein